MDSTASKEGRRRMVTGMFRDRDSAEGAYRSLSDRGYSKDDVNVMMSDDTRKKYFDDEDDSDLGSKALEGAGVGAGIGGTLGAIIAGLAAVGTLAIPGVGLIASGPIAAALAGLGAGGAAGGLVGALVGAGIPEDRAKIYDKGIREGGIIMGVNPRSDEDAAYIEQQWRSNRGEEIYR
jgi:hypothetical protein